ncbi:fusaric acid resistance protein-like domain-containing protein [Hirsutella rhossiliensis]|uniref:Fusaric acid resistance protein-like domain-containing protein n=1 Tax=Hirsutella rhossiliensis TaxID=111463 RepID=A0A9P8N4B7_9HYPO|nr:fusaric acid resistance protein-like domain-containing protein [Hirsutella rhossiliensis]KAH0965711.1 fusaric acid resistance protein-like domain-containing protein [Hirsutella rhossiliensis]
MAPSNPLQWLIVMIWGRCQTNAPWQRMVKYSLASTIALIIALLPPFKANANFLTPMVTVFAHPGQRMGLMIEDLLMVLVGSLIGLSWSLLGLHLSSLVQASNFPAAYTIRGLFLLVSVLVHGYVRSSSPRLLGAVLFLLIASLLAIQLPGTASSSLFTTIYIPILLGAGVLLFVNLAIFPELSSSYLGSSTIDTLSETMDTLTHATHWFVTPGGDPDDNQQQTSLASTCNAENPGKGAKPGFIRKFFSQFPNPFQSSKTGSILSSLPLHSTKLSHLTGQKSKLRGQLSRCRAAQDEINFEICLSPLPPTAMKPISLQYMADMVQNVLTLIGACENKFVVVGKDDHMGDSSTIEEEQDLPITPQYAEGTQKSISMATPDVGEKPKKTKGAYFNQVDSVRPIRELEASSAELLESILERVRSPVQEFQASLTEAANLVVLCVAYCFDVPKLPSGAPAPKGIPLEEIDLRIDHFSDALALFDFQSAEELKQATMDQSGQSIDFLPASAKDQAMPESDETDSHRAADEEPSTKRGSGRNPNHPRPSRIMRMRAKAADAMEWAQGSDDVDYALKLAIAVFLVTWPALVASWTSWYADVRGVWAPMQLILVFEVAIGTSVFSFLIRLFGVVFGCVIGFLAIQIGGGNRIVLVFVVLFGLVPSIYIQVATKYVKAGMISIVSMTVVALAAVNGSPPAYEVFYKRLVAFLVGGFVAMLVEVVVAPVRARDRLVESLSASVRQVQKMQAALAIGIDGPERPNLQSPALLARFDRSRDKAQGALTAAETFLPFCLNEPRLKGSFKPLAPIYEETIYVLHQIIDRMDNVVQLRRAYGSSILEDLNPKVYAYRRNVAASSTLMLFLINEALTTWLPLPQFIPSARLAQLRLINRVREILTSENAGKSNVDLAKSLGVRVEPDEETASLITKRKFLSWNASTAGQMEIIEYLEELVELVKLLVGVNAFRSGMLERPTYRQYIGRMDANREAAATALPGRRGAPAQPEGHEGVALDSSKGSRSGFPLKRAATVLQLADRLRGKGGDAEADGASATQDDGIPRSLQRVGTRLRQDSTVVRRRAFTIGNRPG